MKKAFIFLADGFEEVEAITPIDYLRRAGIQLLTVGVSKKNITSARKITITSDIMLEEAVKMEESLIAVILPGGLPNAQTLAENENVKSIVQKTLSEGGIIAAICASPALALGSWGLLDGKSFTCYPKMGEELKTKPQWEKRIIRDGNIITACSASSAQDFAFAIVEAVCGKTALLKLKHEVVAQ